MPAIVRIVRSEGTTEADAERAKAEAKRARLVTIECCEAMLGLAPAVRTHVIDALRDWAAAADRGPSDMTTQRADARSKPGYEGTFRNLRPV